MISKKLVNAVLILLMLLSLACGAFTVYDVAVNAPEGHQAQDFGGFSENPPAPKIPSDNGVAPQKPRSAVGEYLNYIASGSRLSGGHAALILICCAVFSVCLLFLAFSAKNNKFFLNKEKAAIFALSSVLLTVVLSAAVVFGANAALFGSGSTERDPSSSENGDVQLDESNTAQGENINLSDQFSDITVKNGGSYTLTGSFDHSVIIDAENEDVELILNGAKITNDSTAAILGLAARKITITLADGSENILSSDGDSGYNACIYGNSELVFEGGGKLTVNDFQKNGEGIATEEKNIIFNGGSYTITSNDDGINTGGDGATITINGGEFYIDASGDGIDSNKNAVINGGTLFVMGSEAGGNAAIDTDDGYLINGGTVVALGIDMLQLPKAKSRQSTVSFGLDKIIQGGAAVTLACGDKSVVSFSAPKGFKTIIISTNELESGSYSLYVSDNGGTDSYGITENGAVFGEKLTADGENEFAVSQGVNYFGGRDEQMHGK